MFLKRRVEWSGFAVNSGATMNVRSKRILIIMGKVEDQNQFDLTIQRYLDNYALCYNLIGRPIRCRFAFHNQLVPKMLIRIKKISGCVVGISWFLKAKNY